MRCRRSKLGTPGVTFNPSHVELWDNLTGKSEAALFQQQIDECIHLFFRCFVPVAQASLELLAMAQQLSRPVFTVFWPQCIAPQNERSLSLDLTIGHHLSLTLASIGFQNKAPVQLIRGTCPLEAVKIPLPSSDRSRVGEEKGGDAKLTNLRCRPIDCLNPLEKESF